MRQTSFRPSTLTANEGMPAGKLMVMLSERLAGSSLDYFVNESRLSGSTREFLIKSLWAASIVLLLAYVWNGDDVSPAMYFLMVAATFIFFAPGFRARLSPMLPVSRGRHFKALLTKTAFIYVAVILILLVIRFLVVALEPMLSLTTLPAFARMPLVIVPLLALNAPLLCWGFIAFRSTAGFFVFFFFYVIGITIAGATLDNLMSQMNPLHLLLITAVSWLPLFHIAWKRCLRDDLLTQ